MIFAVLDQHAREKWLHHEETMELHGERDIARNNARCMKARKATHGPWVDNIKTWTGLSVRMTKDRDEWRKYVHDVANPRIEDG